MSVKALEVLNLTTEFHLDDGVARAVDDVSFDLAEGETLGIVGESGSGKSVSALSLMRLIPHPPGKIAAASRVRIGGREILSLSEAEMKRVRGSDIAMIFQDPMTALNPVYTIGNQLSEVIRRHQKLDAGRARERAIELLKTVGIPAARKRVDEYPHQLSGGMRQRAMIAMALSCSPKILIADEPTTALDVTIQAQILELISKLKRDTGMATILITHDLAVVAETCDRVLVMYGGRVIEDAGIYELFEHPRHPYTKGLIDSIPKMGSPGQDGLKAIPGMVPDIFHLPPGCRFANRCFKAQPRCGESAPPLETVSASRQAACYFPLDREGR